MTIYPIEFDDGAKFLVKPSTKAERVLLLACVDGKTLGCADGDDDVTEFWLTLKVSN